MSSLETVLRESYKFIRLTDDMHEMKQILNDIRICFMALTASVYVGLLLYLLVVCLRKRRENEITRQQKLDDEIIFGKWAGHRSPSIRQPEHYRGDEPQEGTTSFYCPRPGTLTSRGGGTTAYFTSTLDRQQAKPLLSENYTGGSATPTPVMSGSIRENGGLVMHHEKRTSLG